MNANETSGASAAAALSGVVIAGTGSALPRRVVTNQDLEELMDTSDEWIVQRTGIHERRIRDDASGESTSSLGAQALRRAMEAAGVGAPELDLIICATMTPDMPTPSVACVVADAVGAGQIAAMDLSAACSGFVYAMNVAHALMLGGAYRCVGVIGADCITRHCDFSTYGRAVSVLFGDAAGACVLRRGAEPGKGLLAQAMHSDGGGARHLYVPMSERDFYDPAECDERKIGRVQMHGTSVFKFAVGTFPGLIEETLEKAGLAPEQVDHYVCHQSNARILAAARDRFGLPEEKMHVNIGSYGNTVGASVPLILDQQTRAGRIFPGQKVMFLAFGAGLTWASSLWQL
jgi:3-oxoacyl-[acyl-carrier-protein] synthase-3